jgi:hypothetical protein
MKMRDPTRVYKYCHVLADAWSELPDWRFAQLITNFIAYLGNDPFFMEDEEFFDKLKKYTGVIS